jgi:hypothetical protein
MWKVFTRPTCASDFFFLIHSMIGILILIFFSEIYQNSFAYHTYHPEMCLKIRLSTMSVEGLPLMLLFSFWNLNKRSRIKKKYYNGTKKVIKFQMNAAPGMFFVLDPWPSAPVTYSPIQPKSKIFNLWRDYALRIKNFMVMMKNSRTPILRLCPMANGHNPAKVPKFKYYAWWFSIDRKFQADDK